MNTNMGESYSSLELSLRSCLSLEKVMELLRLWSINATVYRFRAIIKFSTVYSTMRKHLTVNFWNGIISSSVDWLLGR